MEAQNQAARLEALEAAIRQHRDEKMTVPDCTCWVTHAQRMDAALYALLDKTGSVEERIHLLEEGIRANRNGKRNVPDCPCWGNAPQIVDAALFAKLDEI